MSAPWLMMKVPDLVVVILLTIIQAGIKSPCNIYISSKENEVTPTEIGNQLVLLIQQQEPYESASFVCICVIIQSLFTLRLVLASVVAQPRLSKTGFRFVIFYSVDTCTTCIDEELHLNSSFL